MNKNVDLAGRIVYNEKGDEAFNFGKQQRRLVSGNFPKRTVLLRLDDER